MRYYSLETTGLLPPSRDVLFLRNSMSSCPSILSVSAPQMIQMEQLKSCVCVIMNSAWRGVLQTGIQNRASKDFQ